MAGVVIDGLSNRGGGSPGSFDAGKETGTESAASSPDIRATWPESSCTKPAFKTVPSVLASNRSRCPGACHVFAKHVFAEGGCARIDYGRR